MAAVELVIFDCDGVLIDSERLAIKVDVLALRELGWPLPGTRTRSFCFRPYPTHAPSSISPRPIAVSRRG